MSSPCLWAGTRLIFRLLAALPPLIGAAIIRDLGAITNYTGMVAFLLCFIFPALLQWKSKEMYATFMGEADHQVGILWTVPVLVP